MNSVDRIKAVFIDRDGTINYEKEYVFRIEDFDVIPGALEALKMLTERGIAIYVVTNQAGIAKGYYSEEQFHVLTDYMLNYFREKGIVVEEVLYCPHHPEGLVPEYTKMCECRKPNTLLIESTIKAKKYSIDEVALIGDKNSDIDAGRKLGLTTYLVLTGYGSIHQENTKAKYIKPDLLSAVTHLLLNSRNPV